jgi:hypothetical protein
MILLRYCCKEHQSTEASAAEGQEGIASDRKWRGLRDGLRGHTRHWQHQWHCGPFWKPVGRQSSAGACLALCAWHADESLDSVSLLTDSDVKAGLQSARLALQASEDVSMRDAPSRSGSSTTDSAASETAPQLAQPVTAQPDTSAPAVQAAPADPSEAERARGTELYKQGDWQVHARFLMRME